MTNPVEKSVKLSNVKDVLAYLETKFPQCFSIKGEVRPLKIGIFQDLAERLHDDTVVSKTQLRQALRVYTSSWRYLSVIKAGIARIDLDGLEGDLIDESQAEYAAKTLSESKAKAAEARKAKKQQDITPPVQPEHAKEQSDNDNRKATKQKKTSSKNLNKSSVPFSKTSRTRPSANANSDASTSRISLNPVSAEKLISGTNVLVKLGSSPVAATVIDVSRDQLDVTVQLASGMVVKTRRDSLYSA